MSKNSDNVKFHYISIVANVAPCIFGSIFQVCRLIDMLDNVRTAWIKWNCHEQKTKRV